MRLLCPTVVGRASEMDVLIQLLPAAAQGSGNTVFLTGEAGLGKTRLTREAQRRASELDMLVLRGRAMPSVQYRPLTEALLGLLRRADPAERPELAPYWAALSRLVPEWGVSRPPRVDDQPIVLAEAVLRLLAALARERGCLLVLEDLHDADSDTLMIVDYLADNISDEPILLLGTMRPGCEAAVLSYAAEQRHSAIVLPLAPLDADAIQQMSADCLGLPPAAVPHSALDRVSRASDGVPFFIEELLTGLADDGVLVRQGDRWTASDAAVPQVPAAVHASVVARTQRLDGAGRQLLRMAALYGQPCSGPLLGAATGFRAAELRDALVAALDAQLLVVDTVTGWYVVQHALVGEAVLAATMPEDLAGSAGAAAAAIERTFADLPDEWCVLAGRLWQQAGHTDRAAELFHRGGLRAAEQGGIRTAIELLERGLELLGGSVADHASTPQLVETLLEMLLAAGELQRARQLSAQLDRRAPSELRATIHLRLARAAVTAGQWNVGRRELSKVPALTGAPTSAAVTAATDVVAARLAVAGQDADRLARAELLAGRALYTAEQTQLPEIACEALEVLGCCARGQDLDRSDEVFARGLAMAEQHGLTVWRIQFMFHLGAHTAIRRGDPSGLVEARDTALRAGAIITALDGDAELAVLYVSRGEYDLAISAALHCEQTAHRLGLEGRRLEALGLRICAAAHRGRRDEVTSLMADYDRLGGRPRVFTSALTGFGLALCSLLEEDHARAHAELSEAGAKEAHLPPEYLSLIHGLHLTIAAIAGEAGWAQYEEMARSARGHAGWNRQFMLVAGAVLAGRERRPELAGRLMTEFEQVAAPYPLGRHLGLRLAAEAAIVDGWGRPGQWLRSAEQHFHAAGNPRVAAACRALLRRAGERAPQRRHGIEAVPAQLRRIGVTVREYEVLELVADRLTNQEIGQQLFVSPRTVETHVTRLLAKTGLPDRTALARHVRNVPAAVGAAGEQPQRRSAQ
jgi:DNA-binding CsgD family transcriptional regulator/tetratricopeptide (TPR) repeat protein